MRVQQDANYRLWVWYRSTVPVYLTAYVRNSAGRWRYWAKSAAGRPSKGWSKLSFPSSRTLMGSVLLALVLVPAVGAAVYDRVRRRRAA